MSEKQSKKLLPTRTVNKSGTICYILNGQYHREDGPAVIWTDGKQYWFKYGYFHRINGPARIWPEGHQEFFG